MTLHYTLLPDGRLRVLVDRPEPVRHPWRAAIGIAFGVGVFLATLTLAHGAPLGPPEALGPGELVATAVTTAPALAVRAPRMRRVRYCTGSETEKVHCRTLADAEYDAERMR